jgi:predicted ATPase/DNA-binding SARP family transcriptional activator
MNTRLRIGMFGGLSVQQNDRLITQFRTYKTGALLAFLACHRARPHTREELIALLWPESDLEQGRPSLSVALSSLRHQLEPPGVPAGALLMANRATVQINSATCETDVDAFNAVVTAAATAGTFAEQAKYVGDAIALYRGEFLPGYYEPWCLAERERLAEAYRRALRLRIKHLVKARDLPGAIDCARQVLQLDPLCEATHRDLLRLYVAVGRPNAALEHYHRFEQAMREETGLAPSQAIRRLAREITAHISQRDQDRAEDEPRAANSPPALVVEDPLARNAATIDVADTADAPADRAVPVDRPAEDQLVRGAQGPDIETSPADHLPLRFTRFFGRASDIACLVDMLSPARIEGTPDETPRLNHRLVTLTGPGGIGKTRLALEAADRLRTGFRGDVWFVPLAAVADGDRILETAVQSLSLIRSPDTDPLSQIAEALSGRPALVVLDNFEQLVETGAGVVRALLERIPLLACLIASRRKLNIDGEREYHIAPLPLPEVSDTPELLTAFECVQLFRDRAQAVRVDFQVTDANAPVVAELCRRLEGIPLAIELAASRAQVLTSGQMLAQLEHRFDFLVSRRRDSSDRHRTLRDALDWSYRLLAPDLQRFFGQLAVFRGSWSLDAADRVCMPSAAGGKRIGAMPALDYLAQLRECSMLMTEDAPDIGEIRFRMLESLREYADESIPPGDRENLADRHAEYYLCVAEGARATMRGPDQTLWLDRLAADYPNIQAALQWRLERGAIEEGLRLGSAMERFWLVRGHLTDGFAWLSRFLTRPDAAHNTGPVAYGSLSAGRLAAALGDYATAGSYYEESLRILGVVGDLSGCGAVLHSMGLLAWYQGDQPAALSRYDESLKILRASGDRPELASALSNLAGLMVKQGRYEEARSLLEETLQIRRECCDRWGIASALGNLGVVVREQGDLAASAAFHADSLVLWQEVGDRRSTAESLEMLASTAMVLARFGRAVRLLAAAAGLREAIHAQASPNALADHKSCLATARAAIGEEAFIKAREEGRAMTIEKIVVFALDSC